MFFYLKKVETRAETVEHTEFGRLLALRHSILRSQAIVVTLQDKPGKDLRPDDIGALEQHRWLNG